MRKIILLLGVVGMTAMGASFAACSSDDSTGTTPGTDASTADTFVPPTDSGPGKDSSTPPDAGPCVKCAELITGKGAVSNACKASLNLALAAIACTCSTAATGGPGQGKCDVDSGTAPDGGAACGAFCANPTGTLPDNTCLGCGATQCATEFTACEEDTNAPPKDAGADADAG